MEDYESFKKQIFALTQIDLNAYKEKQMRRRIDSLITKNGIPLHTSGDIGYFKNGAGLTICRLCYSLLSWKGNAICQKILIVKRFTYLNILENTR